MNKYQQQAPTSFNDQVHNSINNVYNTNYNNINAQQTTQQQQQQQQQQNNNNNNQSLSPSSSQPQIPQNNNNNNNGNNNNNQSLSPSSSQHNNLNNSGNGDSGLNGADRNIIQSSGEKKANKLIAKQTKKYNEEMTLYTSGKFFELWRNKEIREKILGYTRIHNLHFDKRVFKCIDDGQLSQSLTNYKYYGYLRSVHLIGFPDHEDELKRVIKSLPTSVVSLELSGYLNKTIFKEGSLPTSITNLVLSSPTKIGYKSIPSHLKSLKFYNGFNDPLLVQGRLEGQTGIIPLLPNEGITALDYGSKFNQPFELDLLPSTLTDVTFGNEFFRPIEVNSLPSCLKHLRLGPRYCIPIPIGSLPNGLLELSLGGTQQNPIIQIGTLPVSLTKLVLDNHFNQPLTIGILPPALKTIIFGPRYNQPLPPSIFPDSLTHLEFHQNSSYIFPLKVGYNVPSNITTLLLSLRSLERNVTLGNNSNIKKLRVGGDFLPLTNNETESVPSKTIGAILNTFSSSKNESTFPRSIESLHLNICNVDKDLTIPSNVTKLIISGNNLHQQSPDIIHVGKKNTKLSTLKFRGYEKQIQLEMFKHMSGNLKTIIFRGAHNHHLKVGAFPSSITSLEFDCLPTQICSGALPTTLKFLRVKSSCAPFLPNSLPPSLLLLECGFYRTYVDSYEIVDEVLVDQQALLAQQALLQAEQAALIHQQNQQAEALQQQQQQQAAAAAAAIVAEQQLANGNDHHDHDSEGDPTITIEPQEIKDGIQVEVQECDQVDQDEDTNTDLKTSQNIYSINNSINSQHGNHLHHLHHGGISNYEDLSDEEEQEQELEQPPISKEWLPPFIQVLIIRGEPTIQLPLPESLHTIHIESRNQSILHNIPLMNQISKQVKVFDYENDTNSIFKRSIIICNNNLSNNHNNNNSNNNNNNNSNSNNSSNNKKKNIKK